MSIKHLSHYDVTSNSICFLYIFLLNCFVDGYFSNAFSLPGDSLPGCSGEPRCRIMFSNINGLHGKLDELAVTASHLDIVFCCVAEMRLSGYCVPVLLPRGSRSNGLEIVMYSRSGLALSRLSTFECY